MCGADNSTEGGSGSTKLAEAFATATSSKTTLDDDDEFEDEETDMDALEAMFSKVNSAVAIEKEVAADTVGELFAATKAAFAPYIAESIPVLIEMLDHYYEGIRKSALGALFAFIKTTYDLSDPEAWVPGGVPVSLHLLQCLSCADGLDRRSVYTPMSRASST